MSAAVFQGAMMQFLETVLEPACVLFMKNRLNPLLQKALTGFVMEVMMALDVALK